MARNSGDIDEIELAAAQWVVRSQSESVREAEIIALTDWLEASDAHADAYRRALSTWYGIDLQTSAEHAVAEPAGNVVSLSRVLDGRLSRNGAARRTVTWAAGAIAATLVAVACLPMLAHRDIPTTTYATAKGQKQSITLADGSVLMLNTDTRVSVRMEDKRRAVVLERGEVALRVVHDEKHPFIVDTGDVRLTDIGTEFNVLRQAGAVRVTVREGAVSLAPQGSGADVLMLRAGDTGMHTDGDTSSRVTHGDPQTAFAWQTSHAIYKDQALSDVVADLNRYYDKPIVVDDATGKLRLTAILTLDSESSVVGRLEDFLSLDAHETAQGIVLRRVAGGRRS
ncbi:FecR family protein [Asticcacaulis solisilvae]|uniref:FecR family protein n=1 Tax=Asticcacaulis solisilvae TaxID=1217274 RepID=UPI003FD857ED